LIHPLNTTNDSRFDIKKLRAGGGEAQFVAIEGYPAEEWEKAARESANLELPL
jgi:hypothetical protein